jgi:Mlc titration factor MtfA (ptsG expression regulator)
MNIFLIILLVLAILALLFGLILRRRKKSVIVQPIPDSFQTILQKDVVFYKALDENKKKEFETRMMHFLATTRITGVKTIVEDSDKVYIAASAIIPIFGFADWEYTNLNEVLVYPDSFNHEFEQTGEGRNVLGMVGDGAYNNIMILSQHELRQAFLNKTGKSNTAIHEFVHLVDKTDGSVDGVPSFFVNQQFVLPWLQLIRKEIKSILADDSDINPYGATNEGEFFAVVAEYFFERPELLADKHPELYELLVKIFRQQPDKN